VQAPTKYELVINLKTAKSTGRTGVVNHAAKPLAGEEKPWFAPPQLALVHRTPLCLKDASGTANCSYHTLILRQQAIE
jgi:hypothetical protein